MAIMPLIVEQGNGSISMYFDNTLSETEQIIVDTYEYKVSWGGAQPTFTKGEPARFILKGIVYSYDEEDNQFMIEKLVLLGFRKDKKIRAKEDWVFRSNYNKPIFDDILPQIPDRYHDKARDFFAQITNDLQNKLDTIIKNGVSVS